jgi:hypothetical protein
VRRVSVLTPPGSPHGARVTAEDGGKTARRRPVAPAAAARSVARVGRAGVWRRLGGNPRCRRSLK